MIDVARHFMTVPTLKRQMDAMESVKLNVLHLHLSDAEAFRVESLVWPKLHSEGSGGQFYSQEEIGDLVSYARDRGIRVVPEFDVPAHTKSWLVGYPELAGKAGKYSLGPEMRDAALNPANERTYAFIDRLFAEMAALFPDPYFHVGGDEVSGRDWSQNVEIEAFMKSHGMRDNTALQGYFTNRIRAILQKYGKAAIGWDEVMGAPALPHDVVVQTWRSSIMQAKASAAGHPVIVSAGYYLDLFLPASFHYSVDPLDTAGFGLTRPQFERIRKLPVAAVFTEDLVIDRPVSLTPQQEALILGGEAAMWSEVVTDEILDGRIWPRMAAIAERFWSPREVRDIDSLYRRLDVVDSDLEVLGLHHRYNQRRMRERLAPGKAGPLEVLASGLEPVRYYGHLLTRSRAGRADAPLSDFIDTLPAQSTAARQFNAAVRAVLKGPRTNGPEVEAIRTQLVAWRDNHQLFSAVARESAVLTRALPASQDLAELASAGLEALDLWLSGKRQMPAWTARTAVLIEAGHRAAAASSDMVSTFLDRQPPSEMLVAILPGIEELGRAANQTR